MRSDREESEEERISKKEKISIGKSESGMPERRFGRLGMGGQGEEPSEARGIESGGETATRTGASRVGPDTQGAVEGKGGAGAPPASAERAPGDREHIEPQGTNRINGDSGGLSEGEKDALRREALSTTAGRESIGAEPYGPGTVDAEKLPTKRGATYRIAYAGEEGTDEEETATQSDRTGSSKEE